jgi:hypothetical protein
VRSLANWCTEPREALGVRPYSGDFHFVPLSAQVLIVFENFEAFPSATLGLASLRQDRLCTILIAIQRTMH